MTVTITLIPVCTLVEVPSFMLTAQPESRCGIACADAKIHER